MATRTDDPIPRIGDWFIARDGSAVGMAVAVLPSGEEVVLARPMRSGVVVETVHRTIDLKGPLLGKRVIP